jgi:hypothetical protein
MMISRYKQALLALPLLGAVPTQCWACATCGCTVNSDAAMGYSTASGWRVNLEYTYIDQDELRSGTGSATAAQAIDSNAELERDTINRYLTLGVSYRPNSSWNLNLLVPYVSRDHTTFGQPQPPFTPADIAPDRISGATVDNLGDVRLIASYQGLLPTHNLGLQLGVKLPTGPYGTTVTFFDGPEKGAPLDASLQAGTGSTDLIAGAYYFQPVSQDFDAFATIQFQAAVFHKLDQPGDDYRPGNAATMSFGVRYEANPSWVPQLQINVSRKGADQGALADRTDTAGTVVYLSPGITVSLWRSLQGYAVLQVPVYSDLDGYQLFPRWTMTMGFSHAF